MINPTPNTPQNSSLALMQANEIEMIRMKADILVKSGFLPESIKTADQAIAIIFYGRELNVPDWTALKHIGVIKGSPQVDGQLALALVQRSGLLEQFTILRSDTKECSLRLKRKGQPTFELTCTLDEAGQMKTTEYRDGKPVQVPLTEKYNWRQQPKTMLFYFTIKQATRRIFSDVLNGMAGSKTGELVVQDIIENETLYDEPGQPVANGQTPTGNPPSRAPSQENVSSADFVELPDWWEAMKAWVAKAFSEMTAEEISHALELAPNWMQDKDTAKAAIIAYQMHYDIEKIGEYTAGHGYTIEVNDEAVEIANRRAQLEGA